MGFNSGLKGLHAKLNPICHCLALLGAYPILHVSRIRVNTKELNVAAAFQGKSFSTSVFIGLVERVDNGSQEKFKLRHAY
jgi:hypothetical protein